MKLVYISHPFTGNETENRQDARALCSDLKEEHKDWCLINPLDNFYFTQMVKITYEEIMAMCMEILQACDAIYLCLGWEKSRGCCAEKKIAEELGMEIFYE
ncbi:MAG: DUF4406 domain-containing protein [Acidaminococcaceae bacterium]|nr:DUF4406 domain-containing protein [Acidaminococcaceae bacterium]